MNVNVEFKIFEVVLTNIHSSDAQAEAQSLTKGLKMSNM